MGRRPLRYIVAVVFLSNVAACRTAAPQPSVRGEATTHTANGRNPLIGTWVLAQTFDPLEQGSVGRCFKVFSAKHWESYCDFRRGGAAGSSNPIDPYFPDQLAAQQAGNFRSPFRGVHGGRYSLEGSTYIEHVDYADSDTDALKGHTFTIEMTLNADTFEQSGTDRGHQIWRRLK